VRGTAAGQGGSHGHVRGGAGREHGRDKNGKEETRATGRAGMRGGLSEWRFFFYFGPAPGEPCSDAESQTGVLIEALPQDYYYIHWRSTLPK
jgi:hypothetical protein